jgi:hypothetical protein
MNWWAVGDLSLLICTQARSFLYQVVIIFLVDSCKDFTAALPIGLFLWRFDVFRSLAHFFTGLQGDVFMPFKMSLQLLHWQATL